ncbi:rhodanese-like domain-containing protein [Thioalkalivibrio sulfidiphilus]|uniref:rhodanese-like domain-containing protein n=1 Tax=Thioalkalivibrio sulfidiphilus TaxID=1033854 RepID=UPI0003668FBD|nr:rhodanese-like domain-containing protein [Thioalkalivibrio sulfidiphilus]
MYGFKEIDTATLRQWQDTGHGFRLLDVRTPAETARGVIPGAEALPLHLLPLRVQELGGDTPLVIYCQSGARSAQACAFLAQHGLDEVYNLRGGIMGWAGSGLPLANLDEAPAMAVGIS